MEINYGKVRAESVPTNYKKVKKLKHMSTSTHIVIHKQKEPVKYVFPWEEYTKQANQSYINNVILGKDK